MMSYWSDRSRKHDHDQLDQNRDPHTANVRALQMGEEMVRSLVPTRSNYRGVRKVCQKQIMWTNKARGRLNYIPAHPSPEL